MSPTSGGHFDLSCTRPCAACPVVWQISMAFQVGHQKGSASARQDEPKRTILKRSKPRWTTKTYAAQKLERASITDTVGSFCILREIINLYLIFLHRVVRNPINYFIYFKKWFFFFIMALACFHSSLKAVLAGFYCQQLKWNEPHEKWQSVCQEMFG